MGTIGRTDILPVSKYGATNEASTGVQLVESLLEKRVVPECNVPSLRS
jgi:hypothetical protein